MYKNKRAIFITALVLSLVLCLGLLYGCGGGSPGVPSPSALPSVPLPSRPNINPPSPTPTPSPTQTSDHSVSLYAVIVGIADYPYPNALNYADKDGRDFYNSLRQSSLWNGAFAATLYNSDATKANIKKYMDDAASKLTEDGMFVFFYSGHGSNSNGLGQLVSYPVNGAYEYVNENEMQAWLSALPSTSKKYVAIDSCYSGLFIGKGYYYKKQNNITPKFIKQESSDSNFKGDFITKSLSSIENMAAITACAGDELSYETSDLQSGVMTYFLVQGIGSGTIIGPAGSGGVVTAEGSYDYASPAIASYAGINDFVQTLQIKDNYSGDMTIKN